MSFTLSNLRLTQSLSRQALRATRSISTTASISEPARKSTVASSSSLKVDVSKPKGTRQYAVLSEHIGGGDFPILTTNRFSPAEIRDGASYLVNQGLATDGLTYDHRVTWGEVDQFQHVNHVRFIEWFESARAFYCGKVFGEECLQGKGTLMILANLNVKYLRQCKNPDTVLIGQGVVEVGRNKFMLRGTAYSLQQREIVAVADQLCLTFDYTKGKVIEIPSELRENIEATRIPA